MLSIRHRCVVDFEGMSNFMLLIVFIGACQAFSFGTPKPSSLDETVMAKIKNAMMVTKQSQLNIALARDACKIWEEIDVLQLGVGPVQVFSSALYASCLARVGRDTEAVDVYEACFRPPSSKYLDIPTKQQLQLECASAMQRLLRYEEAMIQYQDANVAKGTVGAVTCSMRMGNLNIAMDILQTMDDGEHSRDLWIVLNYLSGSHLDESTILKSDYDSVSPLLKWIAQATGIYPGNDFTSSISHLELALINQSPFDDPMLINLDDKVKLHQILSASDSKFWPEGYVLPHEGDKFSRNEGHVQNLDSTSWILKSRSGYGSHGNLILKIREILSMCSSSSFQDPKLLQRLIRPSLLLDGRIFSIRIYVLYFSDGECYISNLGLVKLASQDYGKGCSLDDQYMTNSGRDEDMIQYDLTFLQHKFQLSGWNYNDFWNRISSAIFQTMKSYRTYCHTQIKNCDAPNYISRLATLGIPKILGFDFMVTDRLQPMLLEVNRFPGLEPRGDGDENVKVSVVKDAWICAATRKKIDRSNEFIPKKVSSSYSKLL